MAHAKSITEHLVSALKPGEHYMSGRVTLPTNGYAALVLVGGAALSCARLSRRQATRAQALGTGLIALGGLLPGIGGAMAKTGLVEALYVAEWFGLLLIWLGHRACSRPHVDPLG